jgi:hypothetical protein
VAVVRWHGQITIDPNGIELDAVPPTTNGITNTFHLNGITGYLTGGNGIFAAWTSSPDPTSSQCYTWAKSNGVTYLQLTPGMDLCVLTGSGRTAYLKNINLSSDGRTATARATIWN